MTKGGGRRRTSAFWLYVDATDPMLDAESEFRWCPRTPGALPAVEALLLLPGGLTLSVRTCLWNRVPVAASESCGISSF